MVSKTEAKPRERVQNARRRRRICLGVGAGDEEEDGMDALVAAARDARVCGDIEMTGIL